ncbi:MAG: hypothetical protein BAA04_01480 [Firmicutes bacterium ZCTH02-B6]|nr:MAG: hypothetical protein BAA04_01480 [Firmicutes bacterium ZCTH02-B6]
MIFFGRRTEVVIAGMVLESPPLTIEFDIPFGTGAVDTGTIRVFNLSDDTIARIQETAPVVVRAGYEGDIGTVGVGTVESATTQWEGVDKVTTIIIGDGTHEWTSARVNRTWRQGVRASEVARDIIRLLGLSVGRIDLPNDVTYPSGVTFSTSAQAALEVIAADTGARLHVTRQAVYLVPPDYIERVGVVLTAETGLLDSPEPVTDAPGAYRIRTLLQHRITTDSLVEIRSRTARGEFRVQEGRHKGGATEHVTIATVVPL